MNWPSVIAAGVSGLVGSLLAIFATPVLQHHLWKRQRRAELKLKTIETVNTLTAQFIQQWIAANGAKEEYHPASEWCENFSAADAAVKALFKAETYKVFKNLEQRIDPMLGTEIVNPILNVNAFIEARDAVVTEMYGEVI